MVLVTGQQSTILDTVKHRNSPSSCHISLCAWVRPLTAMPRMLQELTANKVFGAQETYGAAWVWGSPWDGQGHSKQFCHLHRGQDSDSLLQSTIIAVIRTYVGAFSLGMQLAFPS